MVEGERCTCEGVVKDVKKDTESSETGLSCSGMEGLTAVGVPVLEHSFRAEGWESQESAAWPCCSKSTTLGRL